MFGRKKLELTGEENKFLLAMDRDPKDVLAVGRGAQTTMIALTDLCCVNQEDDWEIFGWHEVQSGRWDAETQQQVWTLVTGEKFGVELSEPADLPKIFANRVNETIVVQRMLRVPDTAFTVLIAARRALRKDAELVWTVETLGTANLDDPRVSQFVIQMTEKLKEEYDPSLSGVRPLFSL